MKKIAIIMLAFLFPVFASAATLSLQATPQIIGVGDRVQVTVFINSLVPVNAFSGTLLFPASAFKVEQVSDGNSIVSAWISHPSLVADGQIKFAGITPGGFSGDKGVLFSVILEVTHSSRATLSLANVSVLRNDGAGTPEPTSVGSITFSIAAKHVASFQSATNTIAPEPFTPYMYIQNGVRLLAFSTTDKGSGIDHYEVAERRFPFTALSWVSTTSPYTIHDQDGTSDIYVKAVDQAGNERIAVFHRLYLLKPYEKVVLVVILIAMVLMFVWFIRRKK